MDLRELSDPGGVFGERHDLPARLEEAEDGARRQQQREGKQERLPAFVPGLEPQPEAQADHRVHPGDHQHRELLHAVQGTGDEVRIEQRRVIAVVRPVERVGDARLQDVRGEKERNREAEHQLRRLGERHFQRAAQPQRPECQAVMNGEGAVEEDAAERARPILIDLPQRLVHHLDRYEAEAVIDEMGRHVGEHDEPRSQPQPPDHGFHLRNLSVSARVGVARHRA